MNSTKKIFLLIISSLIVHVNLFSQESKKFEIINQIKTTLVKNQGMSGTCWSFATTSFIETEYIRQTGNEIDLSEMFFVYSAYLDKAKYYVRLHGLSNFSQGGQAHDVINAIEEMGMVTDESFTGLVADKTSFDHYKLETNLKTYLDSIIKIIPIPENWVSGVELFLQKELGTLPLVFKYNETEYSPESFTSDVIKYNPDDYVEITSYNHHPFYEKFDLEIPDNWSHDKYYNVPIEDLMKIITIALETGYSVCWDGDVSEKEFNHRKSSAELSDEDTENVKTKGLQEYRQITFENQTTTDDHLMHLTGIAKNDEGVIYYQTKNSWGSDSNKSDGFLYMSESFIQLKTVAILINKNAIPDEIREKMKN